MAGKKIPMLTGEFTEDYEIIVFQQGMEAVGHSVDVECPDKKAGELIKTSLHDFEGDLTCTEKLGHLFEINKNFDGVEEQASISRDGQFVTFVSNRNGPWDVWVGQLGTGEFQSLTLGRVPEPRNPGLRALSFTPDGALVTLWTRLVDPTAGARDGSLIASPEITREEAYARFSRTPLSAFESPLGEQT